MTLSLKNINKFYGKNHALKDFTADFSPGVNALLGPNGAGKTTLMNIITGNIVPERNDNRAIDWDGESIYKLGKNYRSILGFMPQHQGLYESFTAVRFLSYMAALKGLSAARAREQIPELLEAVELSHAAKKRLGGFSGGMKQRVLIAQALLGAPQLVILDEPTAGVDPKQRVVIRKLIQKISENKIVIISTHIVSDIETIASDVLLLKKGVIAAHGTVKELVDTLPENVEKNLENVYMKHFGDE
ncbi:MAG: ATP-binding cassette domain-containing protein [Oscillospiraceae bacterium]|jgi:ABC-type multidrug transport system ATPase subunit|nr:ATP-binding cassette domain-containing protein [Oscillospiraceae bacterium]